MLSWLVGVAIAAMCVQQSPRPVDADPPSITVHVELAGLGGAVPPPGAPAPVPHVIGPSAGTTVQAIDLASPDLVIAEGTTDERGDVSLDLVPGSYWLIVPWNASGGVGGAPAIGNMSPDGRVVLAWSDATINPGETASATLSIVVALP